VAPSVGYVGAVGRSLHPPVCCGGCLFGVVLWVFFVVWRVFLCSLGVVLVLFSY